MSEAASYDAAPATGNPASSTLIDTLAASTGSLNVAEIVVSTVTLDAPSAGVEDANTGAAISGGTS